MTIDKTDLPYTVCVTGGIGSGKSTVADCFSNLGVPVIDTDDIARTLVIPGSRVLKLIVSHFGNKILAEDGSLNRRKLRQIVFSTPIEKSWLEKLLHPLIQQEVMAKLSSLETDVAIIVVPLLFENSGYPFIDRILVVDVSEETQIHRASTRDQTKADEIKKIINAQVSRQYRLKHANDVVNNENSKEELIDRIEELYEFYQQQARTHQKY